MMASNRLKLNSAKTGRRQHQLSKDRVTFAGSAIRRHWRCAISASCWTPNSRSDLTSTS